MPTNFEIREAASGDAKRLFPLAVSMATSFNVERTSFEESFLDILEDPAAICLVAEKNEEIMGYLIGFDHRAFYANGRVSWVEEIFVTEGFRKGGIGKELMNQFEVWCVERGSKLIGLATRRASNFYQAINYKESATCFLKHLKYNKPQ